MQEVLMEKVVVNMGAGAEPEQMKKCAQVMQLITGRKPVKTTTQAKIPDWGLRPGLEIGLKVTLRGEPAMEFLKRAFAAKGGKISETSFDNNGNFGFGIREHINLPGIKYDPKLGIVGFDVAVALKKKGYRVKRRKLKKSLVGKSHRVTKAEAVEFVKKLGVEVE